MLLLLQTLIIFFSVPLLHRPCAPVPEELSSLIFAEAVRLPHAYLERLSEFSTRILKETKYEMRTFPFQMPGDVVAFHADLPSVNEL